VKKEQKIDELLNSFLDGEATEREQIEVQRLLTNSAQAAKRLKELEKCRMLVGSLPYAEAPVKVMKGIKASIRKMLPKAHKVGVFGRHEGAKHLMIRQVLSAAAMVALVTVLGVVVFTILMPASSSKQPMATNDMKLPVKKIEIKYEKPAQPVAAKAERPIEGAEGVLAGFSGRLQLKTKTLAAVDTSISRAIAESGLVQYSTSGRDRGERVYTVGGSRETVNLLLSDLDSIWGRFDSATLFVETGQTEERVVVDNVKAGQVAEILKQDDSEARIRIAKDIASFNGIEKQLPGKEMFAAVGYEGHDLITIPKPVLTSGERPTTKPAGEIKSQQQILLTIVVAGSE